MKIYILITILFFSIISLFKAQTYEFIYLDDNDFFHQNSKTICMDSTYNIWIGGDKGVYKYDGKEWTLYDMTNSPVARVTEMVCDKDNNIWMANYGHVALMKYSNNEWTEYNSTNTTFPNDQVTSLQVDNNGDVWMKFKNENLYKFDENDITMFSAQDIGLNDLKNNVVIHMAFDKDNTLWMGTDEGLVSYDSKEWKIYNSSNTDLPENFVDYVAIDHKGRKWIETTEGFAIFDDVNWKFYNTSNSNLPGSNIFYIKIDRNGVAWITTNEGLYKFDGEYDAYWAESNSDIPDEFVINLIIDNFDNKWIRSYFGIIVFREGGVILDVEEQAQIQNKTTVIPNPIIDKTTIKYDIPKPGIVHISIYDCLGNEIMKLYKGQMPEGRHEIAFDASMLPNGVYYCRIIGGGACETVKMSVCR